MFNLQGSELIIILLLALVVLGPEKLPEAMRKLGSLYAEVKKMSTSFQDEFKAAVEEPMREMRSTANLLRDSTDFRNLQSGDRAEKPKSAEMVDAGATPVDPVTDVPFTEPEPESQAESETQPLPEGESREPSSASSSDSSSERDAGAESSADREVALDPVASPAPTEFFTQPSTVGPPAARRQSDGLREAIDLTSAADLDGASPPSGQADSDAQPLTTGADEGAHE